MLFSSKFRVSSLMTKSNPFEIYLCTLYADRDNDIVLGAGSGGAHL